MADFYLIVGLGNPGNEYKNTRHNIGFMLIDEIARDFAVDLKKEKKFKGKVAQAKIKEKEVILLEPQTYMNLSGESVKAVLDYYKVDIKKLLIVLDDADISFGEMRLKDNSGTGGHKGLESIQTHLQTSSYARLRMGIGKGSYALEDHVLDDFNKEEQKEIPAILKKAKEAIALWLEQGIAKAANYANMRKCKINEKNQEEKE